MKPGIRQKVNIIIDIALFMIMIALTVIGIVIRYGLIPGSERWLKYGQNVDLTIFGMDRHAWGFVHLMVGLVLLVLLVLHLFFHWKQIVGMVKKLIPNGIFRKIIVGILLVFSCAITAFPFFVTPHISEHAQGFGRNRDAHQSFLEQVMENNKAPQAKEQVLSPAGHKHINEIATEPSKGVGKQTHEEHILHIRGYSSIAELAKTYNVPTEKLKRLLNIPADVSNNERLGRIRRTCDFTMSDVEAAILTLQGE